MINPAIDYISRNPDILSLEVPCSFMAYDVGQLQKVVALHPIEAKPDKIHVKIWHLNEAKAEDILPPFSTMESPKETIKTPWVIFPRGAHPIGYLTEYPKVSNSRSVQPIPQSVYDAICNDMLFSQGHRQNREEFLWKAFVRTFPRVQRIIDAEISSAFVMRNLRAAEPRMYQCWLMWKTHMLEFGFELAPELYWWANSVSFSSSFASAAVQA